MHGRPARPGWLRRGCGLPAIAYGPDTQSWLEATRSFWAYFFRNFWKIRELKRLMRESREPGTQCWAEMSTTLTSLTDGADVLITGLSYQELAANVAEYRDIPLATLLWFPIRVNGHLVPFLPSPLIRSAMTVYEWLVSRGAKKVEVAQRRELGLPKAAGLRRDGSPNADPWKSRPTTRCAFPGWQPNGLSGITDAPLSAR